MTWSIWDLLLLVPALLLGVLIGWSARGRRTPATTPQAPAAPTVTPSPSADPHAATTHPSGLDSAGPQSPGPRSAGLESTGRADEPAALFQHATTVPAPRPAPDADERRAPAAGSMPPASVLTEPTYPAGDTAPAAGHPDARTSWATEPSTGDPDRHEPASAGPAAHDRWETTTPATTYDLAPAAPHADPPSWRAAEADGSTLDHVEELTRERDLTPTPAISRDQDVRDQDGIEAHDVIRDHDVRTDDARDHDTADRQPSPDMPDTDPRPAATVAPPPADVPVFAVEPPAEAPRRTTPVTLAEPAADTPAPADETPAPVMDTPASVVETPAAETPTPVVDTPVQETSAQETSVQDAPVHKAPAEETPVETPAEAEPHTGATAADDFRRLAGVGPKVAGALHAAGIHTFDQLAGTDVATLRDAMRQAGVRSAPNLATWPEQARTLAR